MKKLLISLLCLGMLFCVAACGASEDKTDTTVNDDLNDLGIFGGDSGAASSSSDNSAGADSEEAMQAALYRKYKDIIDRLENERYNDAVQLIAELSNQGKETGDKTPLEQLFNNVWYHYSKNDNYTLPETMSINNGEVTLGDTKYTFLEINSGNTYISGWLIKDGIKEYYIEANKGENDMVAVISIYVTKTVGTETQAGDSAGYYCNLPIVGELFPSWRNMDDKQKDLPSSFNFSRKLAYIDGEYTWTIENITDTGLTVKVEDKYTVTLEKRGDKFVATLTDLTKNTVGYYYSNSHGYDRSWKEYIYPRAIQYLQECQNDLANGYTVSFTSHLAEESKSYSGNAAWREVYNIFVSLGDYRDSKEYADRFIILEDMYTSMAITTVDNMGNVRNSTDVEMTYNSKGQLIETYGSWELYHLYGGNRYTTKYLTYDENGRVVTVREGNVSSLVNLEYDANGRIISGTYKSNSYNQNLSYTYDSQGRLTQSIVWNGGDRYEFNYSYDAQGKLVEIVEWYGWGSTPRRTRYTATFEYDAQGHLAKQTEVEENYSSYNDTFSYSGTVTWTYKCDEEGDLLSASVTEERSSGSVNWATKDYTYNYDDLYYFE